MIGTGAAMLGASLLGAGASLFGANQSANAARDAAAAQERAANKAADTQLEMYNRTRGDLTPWMNTGLGAFSTLAKMYGLPSYRLKQGGGAGAPATGLPGAGGAGEVTGSIGGASSSAGVPGGAAPGGTFGDSGSMWELDPNSGTGTQDFSAFTNSPDYQFALDQGTKSMNRSLAAKGQLVSGNALMAGQRFGQGLASQQFGNYFQRMMSMSGLGQSAAAGSANAGTAAAGQIGNTQMAAGQAQAAGIVGGANAWNAGLGGVTNAMNGGMNNLMMYNMMNRGTGTSYGSPAAQGGMYGPGGWTP